MRTAACSTGIPPRRGCSVTARAKPWAGRCLDLIVPLPVDDAVQEIVRRVWAGDMDAHSVNENRTKDGRIITCEWFNTPLIEEDGTFAGVVSLAQDITERKRTEEALEESRRRFQAIFEYSLEGILLMDDGGRYVDGNPAICQLLGYSHDELVKLTVWDVTPARDRERIPELMSGFLSAGTSSGEYTLLCKGGATREVEYRSVANIHPGLHLGVHRDITERKRAEEALRASEERLRLAADLVGLSNYEWDLGTGVGAGVGRPPQADVGAAARRGRRPGDGVGRRSTRTTARRRSRRPSPRRSTRPATAGTRPSTASSASGTAWSGGLSARGRAIFADGRPVRLVGAVMEITDQKRAEETLRTLNAALENAVEGVARLDTYGRYVAVNPAYAAMLGYQPEELVGMDWEPTVHPNDLEKLKAAYRRMLDAGRAEVEVLGRPQRSFGLLEADRDGRST